MMFHHTKYAFPMHFIRNRRQKCSNLYNVNVHLHQYCAALRYVTTRLHIKINIFVFFVYRLRGHFQFCRIWVSDGTNSQVPSMDRYYSKISRV